MSTFHLDKFSLGVEAFQVAKVPKCGVVDLYSCTGTLVHLLVVTLGLRLIYPLLNEVTVVESVLMNIAICFLM